eukprot:5308979-Pleurochrysis_carterae.AAC.1
MPAPRRGCTWYVCTRWSQARPPSRQKASPSTARRPQSGKRRSCQDRPRASRGNRATPGEQARGPPRRRLRQGRTRTTGTDHERMGKR